MTPSLWVETASTPHVVWANGDELQPYTPFEVTKTLRFGPVDTGADLVWEQPHELIVTPGPGGVLVQSIPGPTTPRLVAVGKTLDHAPMQLRVMTSPHESAGWPRGLARPPGPWTEETLSVLGDQILERGLIVGQRFTTRDPRSDALWLPALTGVRDDDSPVPNWRRGVLEQLSLHAPGTSEFGRAFAMQAVSSSVRHLKIRFNYLSDHSAFMTGLIAGGGLPCLERLQFSDGNPRSAKAPEVAEALKKLPGFRDAFPALNSFEVDRESARPYGVLG